MGDKSDGCLGRLGRKWIVGMFFAFLVSAFQLDGTVADGLLVMDGIDDGVLVSALDGSKVMGCSGHCICGDGIYF